MWSEHTRRLPPLQVRDHVRIQNQTGHNPLNRTKLALSSKSTSLINMWSESTVLGESQSTTASFYGNTSLSWVHQPTTQFMIHPKPTQHKDDGDVESDLNLKTDLQPTTAAQRSPPPSTSDTTDNRPNTPELPPYTYPETHTKINHLLIHSSSWHLLTRLFCFQ